MTVLLIIFMILDLAIGCLEISSDKTDETDLSDN